MLEDTRHSSNNYLIGKTYMTRRTISEEEKGVDFMNKLNINGLDDIAEETDNNYYIIRHGAFATRGEMKLLFAIIAIYMCIGNLEYSVLFLVSSAVWSFVEYILQIYGTRQIQPMLFMGYRLPIYISVILQGMQEGGFVCVYGIWFADRLFSHWYYLIGTNLLMLLLTIWNGMTINDIELYASRRCITSFYPLLALSVTCLINIAGLIFIEFARPMRMLFVMTILGAIWTVGQVLLGMRSVMCGNNYCNQIETFGILSFDVLIEIACAYLPFYFIVKMMGF